ncbi:hypothetical protein C8A00DRAFT_37182 [Chaetomidium leptoderma]|uniref:Uncharacterized protein n=1 Tax=Chaetomidium leptoderma TaxID=669021 RepID=A0AAN6ZTD9_9PEZI|nr:hypothetical protein C8A00DRAFT_37182 [Chaetomidium leptoderma]
MAQANHFWTPGTGSHSKVGVLGQLGPTYDHEDVVCHAWTAILGEYFIRFLPLGQHSYSIDTQAYRGPRPGFQSEHKPDVVVVKMQTTVAVAGGPPVTVSRDILWVECKAPNHDTPNGWKNLIEQASTRLAAAHPNRMLFVISGIGLKWMIFKWDPIAGATAGATASPLQVLASNPGQAWTLRPELRYDPTVPGQSHVVARGNNPVADLIDTSLAYSLDYWTQYQGQVLNWPALRLLEAWIVHILATNYPGDNPPAFP